MANRSHKPVTDASGKPQNNRTATSTPPRYIVMPTQDEADYIAAALESLITQVWTTSVILVVDDGSSRLLKNSPSRTQKRFSTPQLKIAP
jgi:hypothetical protein